MRYNHLSTYNLFALMLWWFNFKLKKCMTQIKDMTCKTRSCRSICINSSIIFIHEWLLEYVIWKYCMSNAIYDLTHKRWIIMMNIDIHHEWKSIYIKASRNVIARTFIPSFIWHDWRQFGMYDDIIHDKKKY